MKKIVVIVFLTAIGVSLQAQQDPKFSQNMFLSPLFNPGAIGQGDKICVAAGFRNQWGGLPDAPVTTSFTAHAPFSLLGRSHGVGINMINDVYGFSNDLSFNAAYSYKIDMGTGVLGIGANAGFMNASLDPEWEYADGVISSGDPFVPEQGESVFGFDMGLGIYYSAENLYAGLSTTHLNRAKFNFEQETGGSVLVRMSNYYYAIAGYTIQLPDPMWEIMPSFMLQTDMNMYHIYLNTNVRYNKKYWGGVSYLSDGAMSILAGLEFMDGLLLGYSYDVELSRLFKYNSGTHEITVRYCFDLSLDKSPQKYESIRFL